jgi:hypothetical protein
MTDFSDIPQIFTGIRDLKFSGPELVCLTAAGYAEKPKGVTFRKWMRRHHAGKIRVMRSPDRSIFRYVSEIEDEVAKRLMEGLP